MNAIIESLNAVARRWNAVKMVAYLLKGLVYGAILPIVLLTVARFVPILHNKWIAVISWMISIILIVGAGWYKRMKITQAAKLVDVELGEDAILTALSLEQQQSETYIGRLVTEQALRAAGQYAKEVEQRIPWQRGWKPRKWISLMSLTIVVLVSFLVLPNDQDVIAEQVKQLEEVTQDTVEQLEEIKEEILQSSLDEQDKEQLLAPIDELIQNLENEKLLKPHHSAELEDALAQLKQQSHEEMAKLQQLNELNEKMAKHTSLDQLQQAMNDAMSQERSQQQETLREALRELTSQQKDALQELAQSLSTKQTELSSLLEEAAEQLDKGTLNEETIEQLGHELNELLSSAEASSLLNQIGDRMSQQLAALSHSLAGIDPELSQSLAEAIQQYKGSEQPATSGSGSGQKGASEGDGDSQGSEPGTGQGGSGKGEEGGTGEGNGTGEGSGEGEGLGQGSGAGTGNSSGVGQGSGQGIGGGQGGSGAGSSRGNHANITTPRIEGEGETSVDGGPSSGGTIQSGGISPMIEGQQGNYSEVFREYETEARHNLSRSTLPSHVQSKVQQYFDSIQPD